MPRIDMTADASSVVTASNQLVAQLQLVNDRIASVTSSVATFNRQGVQVGSVIKGMTTDGQQYTATLGAMTAAQQRLVNSGRLNLLNMNLQKIAYKQTAQEIEQAERRTSGWEVALNRAGRAAQYFVTYKAFNAITNSIEEGITAANKFQVQLSLIRTLSQQNQQTPGQFGAQVRRVSDQSGFNVADVGKAFYDAISNQVAKGPEVEAFTSQITKLARVTGSDLTDAGNAVTASINAYGLSASDAERVSAILFRTVDEGRVVMSELANTLGRVQVLAANVGVSMEEVSSVLAITTQKGFKTADAMTLLTNLLIKLEKPTESTKKFFQGLGVSSGEEAIRLFGFYGVMQKIVEEVRSGKSDVSAFFDEIRGRKQFAVFEQSIDQMRAFSTEISNTSQNIAHYNAAVQIRGESPADYLNIEINKLKNIFTVDIGTKILETTASIVKFTKEAADSASPFVDKIAPAVKTATVALTAYAIMNGVVAVSNIRLAYTAGTAAAALITSSRAMLASAGPAAAFIVLVTAAYVASKQIFSDIVRLRGRADGEIDPAALERNIERLNLLRRREANRNNQDQGDEETSGLTRTATQATDAYRRLGAIIAQVNLANNRLLDDARRKATESSDAIKVSFATYGDRLKAAINDIKKNITEANNEIEKSRKSVLKFQDTIAKILFDTNNRFGSEQQRIVLMENEFQRLRARALEALASSNPERREEGRHLLNQAAQVAQQQFDLEEEIQNRQAQAAGASGRTVDPTRLRVRLNGLLRDQLGIEQNIQTVEAARAATLTQQAEQENARLDRLQAAFRAYQELSPLNARGEIDSRFKDQRGNFDRGAFDRAREAALVAIRANAGGTAQERFALEVELARHRNALNTEANAVDRTERIRTVQAALTAEQEALNTRIQAERTARERLTAQQRTAQQSLLSGVSDIRAFNNAIAEGAKPRVAGQVINVIPEPIRNMLRELDRRTDVYERTIRELETNAQDINGQRVYREQDLEASRAALRAVQEQQNALNTRPGSPGIPTVNGQTIAQTLELATRNFQELATAATGFFQSFDRQQAIEIQLIRLTSREGPLGQLRAAFPELAVEADRSLLQIQGSVNRLGQNAVQPLLDQISELQRQLQRLGGAFNGNGPRAALDDGGGGEVFAAYGGQAGRFPGQPRGKDRYPIWAAKGEFIVNAESSRAFRPMLEAINNRRQPRYMAQGGVVGGDTNVGDINVTVNGGATNSDTGRAIAAKLEREFRRGNITRRK
jgi:TP901 family phage tail tape measure protein